MILTFKPTNQQETLAVHNYLRDHDYKQTEFNRPATFLHSMRIYNKLYQVIVNITKKEFEWSYIQTVAWTHIDYRCATITKLVRFVNPKGWDCVANAMDVMGQSFINSPDESIIPC